MYTANKTKVLCNGPVACVWINTGGDVPYCVLVVETVARAGPRGQCRPSPTRPLHRSGALCTPLGGRSERGSTRGAVAGLRRPSGTHLGWGRAGRKDLTPTGPGSAKSWLELDPLFWIYFYVAVFVWLSWTGYSEGIQESWLKENGNDMEHRFGIEPGACKGYCLHGYCTCRWSQQERCCTLQMCMRRNVCWWQCVHGKLPLTEVAGSVLALCRMTPEKERRKTQIIFIKQLGFSPCLKIRHHSNQQSHFKKKSWSSSFTGGIMRIVTACVSFRKRLLYILWQNSQGAGEWSGRVTFL